MLKSAPTEARFPEVPLAIVGMACRLPGADDLNSYWELMATGKSGIRELPPERLNRRLYLSEEQGQQSKTYSSISGLIPPRSNDPSSDFRSINLDQLQFDPCHEILCGVVDEARINAGWTREKFSSSRTGVYVGHSCGSAIAGELLIGSMIPEVAETLSNLAIFQEIPAEERREILTDLVAKIQHQRTIGQSGYPNLAASCAATLVADHFDLEGPQMAIDAACASSLVALALAGAALNHGEIDQAIVSSASYAKSDSMILFSQARSCSAKGSRPFDADADGLVNAEGYVVILVKTLERAIADRDTIHGIVRGIGISSDGRGRSLWAPRKEGQLEAIRRTYHQDILPGTVQYVEAHATSTQVGDATELDALAEFFNQQHREQKLPLGSVKGNIGHTLESAGLASLLKCVLSMQKGYIPPTINLETPNPNIAWSEHPFSPTKSLIPWPDTVQQPRRAAINAFGIGGLNVHVVVDGPVNVEQLETNDPTRITTSKQIRPMHSADSDHSNSIAIIGRGLVVPGATNMKAFEHLLETGELQIVPPPADRWRPTPFADTRPAIRKAYEQAQGGYIRNYEYDWRTHHIPPRQIEHANPLQFMLLDATQQALDESGYSQRPFDRMKAAVVVGTFFGGDFSHQLQVGLRLPEIIDELTNHLKHRGWEEKRIRKLTDAAQTQILQSYPAINDQTGSFTSSTQASRIAKTLNIMGGAMAIDAGDFSSFAALQSAQHLLRSGIVDSVFCAAAQRDLDTVAFESWGYRVFPSSESKSTVADAKPAPGEGVVVLFLRRLSDAIADKDTIYGIIRDVHAKKRHTQIPSKRLSDAFSIGSDAIVHSPHTSALTRQFGHLQGASGLFEILGITARNSHGPASAISHVINSSTETSDFRVVLERPNRPLLAPKFVNSQLANAVATNSTHSVSTQAIRSHFEPELVGNQIRKSDNGSTRTSFTTPSGDGEVPAELVIDTEFPGFETKMQTVQPASNRSVTTSENDLKILRVWGVDETELRQRVAALEYASETSSSLSDVQRFPARAPFRMSIVTTREQFREKQRIALDLLDQRKAAVRVQTHGIFYCDHIDTDTPLMAAIFPGQGSHRSGMISDIVKVSDAAAKILERADRFLAAHGLPTCSDSLSVDEGSEQTELHSSQINMLTADVCAYRALKEWGISPNFLIGHSFGEYAALVASESISFESALAITLARADAVSTCTHRKGAMLSIAASVKEVQALTRNQTDIFISHLNSPRQTVVAGIESGIAKLAETIKSSGIPAVLVPVGSPFHTPLLAEAQPSLQFVLKQHRWRPPQVPLLSSVSGKFVSDRDDIIENLTKQLTQPLNWVACVERLLAEDVRVFIEAGPGRVLNKLTQQIIGGRNAFAIALDEAMIGPKERQLRIQALMETVGIRSNVSETPVKPLSPSVSTDVSNRVSRTEKHDRAHEPTTGSSVATTLISPLTQPALLPVENEPSAHDDVTVTDPLSDFLVDVIVEQTGYPREVIEFDWDLEADLGIDSIRKAMIVGELREFFDFPPDMDRNLFNELRTLNDILTLLRRSTGKNDWMPKSSVISAADEETVSPTSELDVAINVRSKETNGSHRQLNELPMNEGIDFDEFLIDFVVERTGYPREVVEIDADLESDLGIDSIAKAQLVGEVRDYFELSIDESVARAALSETRTLRQLRSLIETATPTGAKSVHRGHTSGYTNGVDPIVRHTEQSLIRLNKDETNGSTNTFLNRISQFAEVETAEFSFDEISVDDEIAFTRGESWGRSHRMELRSRLLDIADQVNVLEKPSIVRDQTSELAQMSPAEIAQLSGIAAGAELHRLSVFSIRNQFSLPKQEDTSGRIEFASRNHQTLLSIQESSQSDETIRVTSPRTQRFRLEMSPPEIRKWSGKFPEFTGDAIVIGSHPDCEELVRRLESGGIAVYWLQDLGNRDESITRLDDIWKSKPATHLFILSPRDAVAGATFEERKWKNRRSSAITNLYWFCQRWVALLEQSGLVDEASLVGVASLGGDYGIAGHIASAEGGAVAGLLKAIVIETWVNGHRTIPIKLLDMPVDQSPTAVVDAILFELTEPSYDVEIGWNRDARSVLRSIPDQLVNSSTAALTPTGNWVVTGGARGITAYLVKQLGQTFSDVHFHLVGTAPVPKLTEEQRRLAAAEPAKLRSDCMQRAKSEKQSPLKAWQELEKEIEIDRTLAGLSAMGINATYHSCDVGNRDQLSKVLDSIRVTGPIRGVIHGAGIGKDASFLMKDPVMVERCISAKIDGALNLMALTAEDPLQAFIASGSISGRFGANGHTDYSMANDMLAKLIVWHRQLRPTVPSTVFHWHAWDDIGMATKAETRLALEMIGMKLMPAKEGADHFIREIKAGLPLTEILITDTRYYRMFYPADRMLAQPILPHGVQTWPLIHSTKATSNGIVVSDATLNPLLDPYLRDHRLNDRPLLPMVIMVELLAEGAAAAQTGRTPKRLLDFEIATSLKFATDVQCDVQVTSLQSSPNASSTELRADFRSRNGKLVSPNRLYAKASVAFDANEPDPTFKANFPQKELSCAEWKSVQYPRTTDDFYIGGPLQCLRKFSIDLENKRIWGKLSAPSLGELAGPERDVSKWLTPSAILDATLFTSGILAWCLRPGVALPQRFQEFSLHDIPRPAELCWVRSQIIHADDSSITFDIAVWGNDHRPLFSLKSYVAAWLPK